MNEDSPKSESPQMMFEERSSLYWNQLSITCDEENVNTAICIVADPKFEDRPLIFVRGNIYDQAKLLTLVLRKLKEDIARELST